MPVSRLLYRLAQGTLRTLTPVLAPVVARRFSKVARGLRGRRSAHEILAAWGERHRDPARPLVWFHAPSVGEGLQARAVLEALQRRTPELQSVFTHFSPSAEGLARRMPADVAGYLPWDLVGPVGRVLEVVRPDVLAFTKTEVWPVLVEAAAARDVPAALVAATVPPGAGRLSPAARAFLRPTWRRLRLAAAIAEDDAARLEELGVPGSALRVTGDPAIDSAARRAAAADPAEPWLAPFHADPRPTVVAGSTWPPDEAVLLPAMDRVREAVQEIRLVVAPHEPEPEHVRGLLAVLRERGWRSGTLAEAEGGGVGGLDAVVVDRVGVLAHLYTVGMAAYVGGGFGDDGLHSVLEPAAAALPVAFGPRHHNARAAGDLAADGGGAVAEDADALARILRRWFVEPGARDYAAARAFGYIDRHRGAADRTAALLRELLPSPRSTHSP
jgi:3-deoxy-D-manno-octulosonic-acid transferase